MKYSVKKLRVCLHLLLFFVLNWTVAGWAQRTLATLQGTVTDTSSAVIPSAEIDLLSLQTHVHRQATTGSNGTFVFPQVEPGQYEITVQAAGMETERRTGIVVTTGIVNEVTLQMRIGSTASTVVVEGGTQMVNTADAAISGLVNADQVHAMPLDVRSFSSLVKLEPTVTPGGISNNSEASANTDTGGFVAGQRAWDTAYTVDGGNVMSPTWPEPVWAVTANGGISLDAIREFRIFTSNKPADAGGKSGAYIAITTKSGSNTFHGSAFEYFRNTVLDARNYFDAKRLPYQQNQFGGSLGGPAWKGKSAYFFGSYEGFRAKQPLGLNLTVPTPLLLANVPSGATHGYLREIMENTYPAPLAGYSPTALVATANSTYDNGNVRDMGSGRLDVQLPHQNQLTLRYLQVDGHSGFGATTATGVLGGNVAQEWSGNNGLIRLTTTLSPTKVNEVHVDYDRSYTNFVGEPPPAALIALGFSADSLSPNGIPYITVNGTGLQVDGPPTWLPDLRHENSYEYADTFTWIHGKHSISSGGQWLRSQDNAVAVSNLRPSATFQGFGGAFDGSPTGITTGVFQTQTQSLLQTGDSGKRGYREGELTFFVHDNYHVSNRFSLDAGLRWSYDSPFTEAKGRLNNAYIANGSGVAIPGASVTLDNIQSIVLANPADGHVTYSQKVWTAFAPNVGMNWDVRGNGASVLSGGYSIAYERPFMNYLQNAAANVPFVTSTSLQKQPFGTVAGSGAVAAGPPSLFTYNPSSTLPYVQYWNLTLQQSMWKNAVGQVSYIGNKGTHLYSDLQVNKGGAYADTRPNPNYTTVEQVGTDAIANYNALAAQLQQRYTSGVTLQFVYTYAKSLDTASAANLGSGDYPVDEANRQGEYGRSDFDVRQVFTGNAVYKLPFGKDEKFHPCSRGLACDAVSGWQLSTIFSLHTGGVFNLLSGQDNNGDGVVNDRAFQIAPTLGSLLHRSGLAKTQFLNPAAVGVNIAATGTSSLSRNAFTGPGFRDFDVEARKVTNITEALTATFIAQGFNIFNNTNFGDPVNTVSSATFGQLQSVVVNGGARVVQFALRFDF